MKLPEPNRLKVGDRVRIVNQTNFRDHIGLYQGMSGKERVYVLLELLGRQVRVDLPCTEIQPQHIA